jgi:hypothetical protein
MQVLKLRCTFIRLLYRPPYIQMAPLSEKQSSVPGPKGDVHHDGPFPSTQTEAVDEESQSPRVDQQSPSSTLSGQDEHDYHDNSNVPKLSYPKLFWFFFYNFGLFAWGGPVAQIALIKERLVIQDKWITLRRFQRVFSVYQILPGPEAAELCMFFGCLSAGRIGGILAGLAFILPTTSLTMATSQYARQRLGLEDPKNSRGWGRGLEEPVETINLLTVSCGWGTACRSPFDFSWTAVEAHQVTESLMPFPALV